MDWWDDRSRLELKEPGPLGGGTKGFSSSTRSCPPKGPWLLGRRQEGGLKCDGPD